MTNLAEKLNFRSKKSVIKKTEASNSLISPIALAALGLFGALEVQAAQSIEPVTDRAELLGAARAAFEAGGLAPERIEALMQLLASAPLDQLESLVTKSLAAVAASLEQIPVETAVSADDLIQVVMQQAAAGLEAGGVDLSPLPAIVSKVDGFYDVEPQQMLDRIDGLSDAISGAFKAGRAEGQGADTFVQLLAAADTGTKSDSAPSTGAEAATAAAAAVGPVNIGLMLLALAAGGGGGGGGSAAAGSSSGAVVKGPLSGAFVFRDANDNYSYDAGEYSTTTASDGTYTLEGSGGTIIAMADPTPGAAAPTDSFSNATFAGVLASPSNASVVTPLTTLLAADTNLTVEDLQLSMGLAGIDLLTFNPFGAGVSDADKLKVEKVALQVQEVLVSAGSVVAGGGSISLANAVKFVAQSVASVAKTAATSVKGGGAALDLSSTATLSTVMQDVSDNTGVAAAALSSVTTAVAASNTKFKQATDLTKLATVAKASADALVAKVANATSDSNTAPALKSGFSAISIQVAEDASIGGDAATAEVAGVSRSNMLAFLDGDASTQASSPTIDVDLSGFSITGSGTADISATLTKDGVDTGLTLTVADLKVVTSNGLDFEENQTATIKLFVGPDLITSFALANADQLLDVTDGKLSVDFAAFMQQIQDASLDTSTLSVSQITTLAKAVVAGVLESTTTESLVALLKASLTAPEGLSTVADYAKLLQDVIDLPAISGMTVDSFLSGITNGELSDLVDQYLTALGVDGSDTLSDALTTISDGALADWTPGEVLNRVIEIASQKELTGSDLSALLDDMVTFVVDAVSDAGLSRAELVDKLLSGVTDLNQLASLLDAIDLSDILGADVDLKGVALQLLDDQSVDLSLLVPIIAKLAFSTDSTIDLTIGDFSGGLQVTQGGSPVYGFNFSIPIGTESAPDVDASSLGFVIPAGTFTDKEDGDNLSYTLEYGALADGKFVKGALPTWVKFDSDTGEVTGKPDNDAVGVHYFVITAFDTAGKATRAVNLDDAAKPYTFKLTVTEVNDPPTAVDIPAQTIGEGLTADAIDLSQYFSDIDTTADYNTLTYTVESTGAAAGTIKPGTAELTIAASIIDGTDAGAGTVTVTASDGKGGSVSKDISVSVTQDTTAPIAPNASFVDNGSSESDGITSLGAVTVSGLETGATIEISTNDGTSWTAQSLVDGKFTLPNGVYAEDVSIRAVDAAGNEGAGTTLGITEVVAAPATPTLTLGAAKEGTVAVGNLADVYTGLAGWQYSTDGGSTWSATQQSVGNDAKFTVQDASYAVGAIQVRSVNTAGFTSEAAESAAVWVVDTVAPTIASFSAGVLSGDVVTYDVSFTEAVVGVGVDDFTVGTNVTKTSVQLKSNTTATYEVALTVGAREASDIALDIAADAAITDAAGNAFVPGDVPDTISVADYLVGKTGSTLTSLNSGAGAETFIFGSTTDTLVIDAATDSTASATDTINGFTSGADKIDISALLSDYSGLSTKTYTSDSKLSFIFETIALNEEGAVTTDPSAAVSHALRAKVYAKDGLFTGEDGTSTEGLIAFTIADVTGVGEMSVALSSAVFKGTPVTLVDGTLVSMGSEFVKAVAAGGYLGAVTITPSAGDSEAAVQSFADSFEMMLDTLSITLGSDTSTETDLPLPVSVSHPNGRTVSAVDELYTLGAAGDNSISISSVGGQTTVVYDDNPAAGTTTPTTLVFQTYATDGESVVNLSSTDFIFSS